MQRSRRGVQRSPQPDDCHAYVAVSQWAQARAALTAAIEMYRAMGMTFWLPQAAAALEQVSE